MRDDRRQILPFTLTELFVLLFFALALALAQESRDRQQAQEEAGENRELASAMRGLGAEQASALIRIIQAGAESVPEDFQELKRMVEEQVAIRTGAAPLLKAAGMDSAFVDTASLGSLLDSLQSAYEQGRSRYEILSQALASNDDNQSALVGLADSITRLTQANQDLTGQIINIRNGLDHPPCWADEAGEIEYAFRVILRTEEVTVRPIWPEHRTDDARAIPGMISAAGEAISYEEFSRRVLPIFAWSTRQNPECRHFVAILDSVAGGKEPFKQGLFTVERFFYKRLDN